MTCLSFQKYKCSHKKALINCKNLSDIENSYVSKLRCFYKVFLHEIIIFKYKIDTLLANGDT